MGALVGIIKGLTASGDSDGLAVMGDVVGAIVGLAVLSRVLSWLFKKYHNTAVALVTGFVAGSLIIIWPWKNAVYSGVIKGKVITWDRYFPNILDSSTWIAIAWLLAGIALIAVIEKLSAKPAA